MEKIELFTKQGLERFILKDGHKIGTIVPRLTIVKDENNWLSMQPIPLRWFNKAMYGDLFGELKANNILHGRGIRIWNDGDIDIGFW